MEQGLLNDLLTQERAVKVKWIADERQRLCREVADSLDSKDLAAVCGISYQYVRAMLNRNGEKKDWNNIYDGALMILAPDLYAEKVLSFDAEMAGREEPPKKHPLTPEERLAALEKRIRDHGLEKLFGELL